MDIEREVRGAAIALLVVAGVACGTSAEDRRKMDSAVAAAAQAKVATQAGEVLSARLEAQPYLDGARSAFVARDRGAASKGLRDAAAFTRGQADSAIEPAKKALAASADELNRLATRVSKGSVKTVKTLDNTFARMQLAEAQLHCTRALDASNRKNAGATSAEIVMLVDHFERAAADAGNPLSASAQQAVATARSLAGKLTQTANVPQADVDAALAAMDKEVHGMMATAAKLKG
jgi:hypothetical protein